MASNPMKKTIQFSQIITCLALILSGSELLAAKVPYSKKQLESVATHIVSGKVQAIYTRTERQGSYEYIHKVAEVKIDKEEKGEGPERLIYIRYWSRKWKGIGRQPPGGGSYWPQPKKGLTCRFYLARNAYDGWSRNSSQDGGNNVVYVNGVQPTKK